MAVKRNYTGTAGEYTVSYSDMRGVDFSSSSGNGKRYRFSYLENMYRDYAGGGGGITESVPGFRKITTVYKNVHSIYTHKSLDGEEFVVFHAGESLYRFPLNQRDEITLQSPITSIKDTKSRGFVSGSDLYILDGENITRVRGDGTAERVGDDGALPYVPTTYYNGKEYEQRNLLTERFKERYVITAASDVAARSEGLTFKIISEEEKLAAVSGIESGAGGAVYIPSYVSIGNEKYKVTEILDSAFSFNKLITSVTLSDTVTRVGKMAFMGCSSLKTVITRDSIKTIDNSAFIDCTALEKFHLGSGIYHIGVAVFNLCTSLKSIDYAGDAHTFENDVFKDFDFSGITIVYGVRHNAISIEIPIMSPAKSIEKVTVDGANTQYSLKIKDEFMTAVIIQSDNRDALDGREVEIQGTMDPATFTKNSAGTNFLSESGAKISGREAILGCTVAECFDGRVFLSGNKSLPNTVFYSSRDLSGRNNPLYFGILNYFNDGVGSFGVKSMLATGEALAVFKEGDDGGGSIYYHTRRDTDIDILPTIYPVSYIHSGIFAIGESISFFDDPIFISSLGVSALDKKTINLERSIATRSTNVNAKLLGEDLSKISLAKWCGYLVLLAGEHIYLADSRQTFVGELGYAEYEWYYLTGIGEYRDATRVYKYSEEAKEGYTAHPTKANLEVDSPVYLSMTANNQTVYYTRESGVKYEVYTDGEMRGGEFFPATCVASAGDDLLLFGTSGGDICIFNNDKRGVPPTFVAEQSDFDADEYAKAYGRRIHPSFYTFDKHPARFAMTTVSDNGGIPHLTKSTVKHSLAVKLRSIGTGDIICEVGTEKRGYKEIAKLPDATLNFSEFDFSSLSFENNDFITLPLREREKGWIEKSVGFYSDKYASPFGISSLSYRFFVKGRIK